MDLEPDDVLEPAMIGPPGGGLVDLLIGTEHLLWKPDDPGGLAELVGFGLVARTKNAASSAPSRSARSAGARCCSPNSDLDELRHSLGGRRAGQAIEQAMSAPQHIGDLILPCPFGHLETCTDDPSSFWIVSFTSGASHSPQVAFTDIPQVGQE